MQRNWIIASIAALTVAVLPSGVTYAFKVPIHKEMTRSSLTTRGFAARPAGEVADANGSTDTSLDALSSAAHADNNQLDAASDRLKDKIKEIGKQLKACNPRKARKALGGALHTVQDVFAHSNAIDNGQPVSLLNMARGSAWCDASNGFAPGGLVSGYFSAGGFMTFNQCRGMPAGWCCHRDLNKDDPTVPNGARFAAARSEAISQTGLYLDLLNDNLKSQFGETQAEHYEKMLRQPQRMIFFTIDDTGSMSGDIAGVKSAVNSYLDAVTATEAPTLGLVTFKDNVSDRGTSCDLDAFRSQINSLYASGGGDCPEVSNSAMLTALGYFSEGSSSSAVAGGRIVLATDASAGDASYGPFIRSVANRKGVSIDAILTGDCTEEESSSALMFKATGNLDLFTCPSNNSSVSQSFTMQAAPAVAPKAEAADPLTSPSARTQLRALTEQTGGVLFQVGRIEVKEVVPTLLQLGDPATAVAFSQRVVLAAGSPAEIEIPVDDTLAGALTFMVTPYRKADLPTFTLLRPDGGVVSDTDPGVAHTRLSSVESYALANGAVGVWKARLEGSGQFTVRAFGSTSLQIDAIQLFDPSTPPTRPDVDLMPIVGDPLVGQSIIMDVRLTEQPASASLALRRADGTLLGAISSTSQGDATFRSQMVVPSEPFIVEVTGTTAGGAAFVRRATVPVLPQTVSILVQPRMIEAPPASAAPFDLQIKNIGATETQLRVSATSQLGWKVELPEAAPVPAGGTVTWKARVQVPADTPDTTLDDVVFVVEDTNDTRIRNSATGSVLVRSNRPPDCAGAKADVEKLWPPNHGLVDVKLLGITDPDGDPVHLVIDGVTQDEKMVCSSKLCQKADELQIPCMIRSGGKIVTRTMGICSCLFGPDAFGLGTDTATIRAERDERGDGRVYAVRFTASDDKGGSCSSSINIGVPHDQKHPAVDSGQKYDSTGATCE